LDLRGFGGGYIATTNTGNYSTVIGANSLSADSGVTINGNVVADGANPNPKAFVGLYAEAAYAFWFHKALSLGADFYDSYQWYYAVHGPIASNDPSWPAPQTNALITPAQQMLQTFGIEVYVRYELPKWHGIQADLQVAFADGDAVMGYPSVLTDGRQN